MTTFIGSPPYVTTSPAVSSPVNKAYSKAFRILGIIQILLGTLSIITWCYALAFAASSFYYDIFAFISAGIWCGIFFLVAGILAAVSSVEPNNCKIISGLVMSIFAALFATTMFALETIGAINAQYAANWYRYNGYYCTPYYKESYYQSSTYVPTCNNPTRPSEYIESVYIPSTYVSCNYYNGYSNGGVGMSTLHGFMAFYAFVELIVAIVHSVYCCKYKCGPQSSPATRPVVQYVYQHPITQQMPGSNVSHPGGIPMPGTYTTAGTVPYQIQPVPHIYTNQDNMMINQHNTGNPVMTSPNPMTSHDATSSGNTSLPKYSEIQQPQQ